MGTLIVDNIKKRDGSNGTDVGTGASISSPGANILTLGTNNTEKVRILADGTTSVGTISATPGTVAAGSLVLTNTNAGFFSNVGGDAKFGSSDNNNVLFQVNGAEKVRIATSGQIGLGGANYGTAGQVITSNGSGSAPTWQDAISYGSIAHTDVDIRERNGGASLGGGSSSDGGRWVKIGNQVHLWGHATTSAGTGGNTTVVALAILDTNLPAIVNDGRNPYGPCVGTVAFNAQTNFSNVVGAYAKGPSSSDSAAIREFGLYVETQSGNTLETVTKYCTVEDIGTCAFNFDIWYECTP